MTERCSEILKQAELLLDGEADRLDPAQVETIRAHLADCVPCECNHNLQARILSRLNAIAPLQEPCPDDLRSRITDLLDQA